MACPSFPIGYSMVIDELSPDGITLEESIRFTKILEDARKSVNEQVPEFMTVSKVRIHPEEFVKTPKRSIKRFYIQMNRPPPLLKGG
jgi:hypothetical protein